MSYKDIEETSITIILKLGDIIQLKTISNKETDNEIFIISYIDTHQIILDHPDLGRIRIVIDPDGNLSLLKKDNTGILSGISIEEIALLNRSDNEGYLAQNNINIGDLLELVFIDEKIYGQVSQIEEDMMTVSIYPSKEIIYIDFAYKGVPTNLNLTEINIIDSFPKDVVVDQEPKEVEQEQTEQVDENTEQEKTTQQLFIDADQLFIGKEIGEVKQQVQMGEKERRYGIDTQLNDLLEELLSVVPNDERNSRVMANINNMIQKFKQLRYKHSNFDDFNNASKKQFDKTIAYPLVKEIISLENNIKWLIPVIKARKQLYNINNDAVINEENITPNVDISNDLKILSALNDFIDNYHKNNTTTNQNKYDQYLRYMKDYFKSVSPVETSVSLTNNIAVYEPIINDTQLTNVNARINAVIDTLGDLYSEIAKGGSKNTIELSKSRFNSLSLHGNIERKQLLKSKMGEPYVENIPISNGDRAQLSSFLLLPQKIVSPNDVHINTLIIDKTTTSTNIDYYKYLRTSTSIVTHYVDTDSFDDDTQLTRRVSSHITGNIKKTNNLLHIKPSQSYVDAMENTDDEEKKRIYSDFLFQFIPSNDNIIAEIESYKDETLKYITTIHDFISKMSTFMMSKDNFTHNNALKVQNILNSNISFIKQRLIKRGDELGTLVEKEALTKGITDMKTYHNSIHLLLNSVPLVDVEEADTTISNNKGEEGHNDDGSNLAIINIIRSSLKNYYEITETLQTSETLDLINKYDNGRFLNLCISYLSINLHSKIDISNELNAIEQMINAQVENESASNDCVEVSLSKKYTTLAELNADNKQFVYYDKQYDNTRYDIIELYSQQKETMQPQQFKEFLKNKLIENIGMTEDTAMKEADAMISGNRLVEEGDVALLEIGGDIPRYYSRINNEWKRNTSIKYDVQSGSLLCDTKQGCYTIKNKCADNELAKELINSSNIQSMINIFDIKQEKTRKQLKNALKKSIQLLYSNKANYDELKNTQRKEENREKNRIASEMLATQIKDSTKVVSPYSKLFQAIMGQEDFVQKQHNIIKFVSQFTYDTNENYWFLCIKTSQKLVPKFLYRLAKAFVGREDFFLVREQICSTQGVLSDDGDAWVDKYSGYVIKTVDASGEEGYDKQGYKLQARETLENTMDTLIKERQQDINNAIAGKTGTGDTSKSSPGGTLDIKDSYFTAPYSDIVLKIINALGRSIGLDLNQHKPFIVNNVLRLNSANFTTKEDYDKKASIAKKQKNITLPSFEIALNLNIIILTCCLIILAIQLSKPAMKTKKNVAGCFKYFKGFPYEANGDNGAIVYLSCVIGKIKNAESLPWKALGKTKSTVLVNKIMTKYEKQVLLDKQISDDIEDRRAWALQHPHDEVDEEVIVDENTTLAKWGTFKPSLDVNYDVAAISPLSEEFKQEMLSDIKKGSREHHAKVNTLMGKIIEQSIFYKNKINTIVADSSMILNNVYQEPYMQNCFGNTLMSDSSISAYLNSKDQLLDIYVKSIERNEKILYDLRKIIKSPMMNPHFNTHKTIKTDMGDFTEETIYKYFIKQCKYETNDVIEPELTRLCGSKPDGFDGELPIKEQIKFLKSNGYQYSTDALMTLLKYTGNKYTVNKESLIQLYDNSHFVFKDFMNALGAIHNKTPLYKYLFDIEVNDSVVRLFSLINTSPDGYINDATYKKISKEGGALREVKNNLSYAIDKNKQNMLDFLNSQSSVTKKHKKQHEELMSLFENAPKHYDALKQLMYLLCIVFPNMVVNGANYSNINMPKHWGLSALHERDINTFITNYYKRFKQFYSNETSRDTEQSDIDDMNTSYNSTTLLRRVMLLCKVPLKQLYNTVVSLPFNTKYKSNKGDSIFLLDERFYELFLNYVFTKSINLYVKSAVLVNERSITLHTFERNLLGLNQNGNISENRKYEAITEDDINEFMNRQLSDEDIVYNDDITLLGLMNEYLLEIHPLILSYYKNATTTYEDIHKRVMSSRENEKNTITRTLKDMSDEEREIQNLFKGHKLESWGKGLTKGLTRYVKDDYDDERANMEKRLEYERKINNIDLATKMNMEIFMENAEYEELLNKEIENEEYSMEHLGEDDDHGDMDGDEYY
jgi:hypothetical protein